MSMASDEPALWQQYFDDAVDAYYYNTLTGETTWSQPCEFVARSLPPTAYRQQGSSAPAANAAACYADTRLLAPNRSGLIGAGDMPSPAARQKPAETAGEAWSSLAVGEADPSIRAGLTRCVPFPGQPPVSYFIPVPGALKRHAFPRLEEFCD
jgi:hypothetical protein